MKKRTLKYICICASGRVTPLPGQFRLVHDGKTINISSGSLYQYSLSDLIERGAYRIEVHVQLNGKCVPWIYSNPIYIC